MIRRTPHAVRPLFAAFVLALTLAPPLAFAPADSPPPILAEQHGGNGG